MRIAQWVGSASITLSALILSSCGGGTGPSAVKLQGAGASFPAPLYSKWFKTYSTNHPNLQIDYQSVGSGGGIKSFIDKTVDFGASDAAMTPEEIAKVDVGVQLLPMTSGSIVLSYSLEGVTELKLSRKAKLPDKAINVVVRADSSGTSFVFTKHLSAISPEFAKSPGVNKMPNWAVGTKSKGNEGVTAAIKTTPGSIGYIEYGYAMTQKMPMVTLENKSGAFVAPTTASGQAALASAELPDNMIAWVSDPTAKDAYPIVTFTWVLCYKQYTDKAKLQALKDVLLYGLTDGQKDAEALGYIPLPAPVVEKGKAAIQSIQ